jgi:hypothetical protein
VGLPRLAVTAYYQKEASSMKQAYLRDVLKQPPRVVVSLDLLSPPPSTSSAVKLLENRGIN